MDHGPHPHSVKQRHAAISMGIPTVRYTRVLMLISGYTINHDTSHNHYEIADEQHGLYFDDPKQL